MDLESQYKFKFITVISVLYVYTAKFYRFIEGRSYSTIILSFENTTTNYYFHWDGTLILIKFLHNTYIFIYSKKYIPIQI